MNFRIFLPFLATPLFAQLPEVVDFNDHVQPILSENCYHCHGPDSSTREPKNNPLRLDREEFAFLVRPDGKPSIIKGNADESEVIRRIISKDPEMVMPTPESHRDPLKPEQVALLKKWINQGAPYEEHWSFIAPEAPPVPEISWGKNAVDAFVAAKHRDRHLTPQPPAPAHRLLRRLSFDLTGLPPSPEEIETFITAYQTNPQAAVAGEIDRLLDTDGYAENFARHWLDAARYADTHGIHIDNYRSIWPYRDWVIEAIRENKSFKDFTIEQIAGDLLPGSTIPQKVATGFNRCLPTTGEGGAIAKEYETIYATDRVETVSAVWLGLTTSCAACHDHKFDPISQKDFYQLAAYFRNTTMPVMDRNSETHPPSIFAPASEDLTEWNSLVGQINQLEKEISQNRKNGKSLASSWMAAQGTTPVDDPMEAELFLPLIVENGKIIGDHSGKHLTWDFPGRTKDRKTYGKVTNLQKIDLPLGDLASFEAHEQVTFGGYIRTDRASGPIFSRMNVKKASRGWDIWLEKGRLGAHIVDTWPKKAIKAMTKKQLARNVWQHVMVSYDGQAPPEKSLTVYIDGEKQSLKYSHHSKIDTIITDAPARLGGRHPDTRIAKMVLFHGFQFHRRKLSPSEIKESARQLNVSGLLSIPETERTKTQIASIEDYYFKRVDPTAKNLRAKRDQLIEKQNLLKKRGAMTLVMEEKKGEAYAHILDRGDYSLEKEKVLANIPELFRSSDNQTKAQNRLDLARWLVSDENPLTARVTVNRIWYYFFGRGLVETTEDFGIMGGRPTHPELLDFLAVEFIKNDWDVQHIIRLIANSATYQQSGIVTSDSREKDPENLYLSRSPRHRMDAEQIRDMALASSGLLVRKVGGPPVKPYQPEGVWEAVAMHQSNTRHYKEGKGEDLYRRSLYTFWKRTAPHPSMEILNAPSREVFCVRRDLTNTPLQAFVTLNDVQFVEAGRKLAEKALSLSQDFDDRLDQISLSLIGRIFEADERSLVRDTFQKLSNHYQVNPKLAEELIAVGKSNSAVNATELAPWTMIASQVFNLDETLTK